MRKQILIVAFACLSVVAVAQSAKTEPAPKASNRESSSPSVSEVTMTKAKGNKQNAATAAPASGHPTGKRQHDPVTVKKSTDVSSPKLSQ